MAQQPLLRFVEFVKKHIGSNHLTIAEYFNEEISEMASECRVNWNETKNNLNYRASVLLWTIYILPPVEFRCFPPVF